MWTLEDMKSIDKLLQPLDNVNHFFYVNYIQV